MRVAPAATIFSEIVESADSARSLDAHVGTDGAAHQLDIVHRGAGRAESGGSFHEVGAGEFGERAGAGFLIVTEQRGFENHFHDRAGAMAGARR